MECNKEEAERCKSLSEATFRKQDLAGARKYALKARQLFPDLDGLPQLLSILGVHIAAHQKLPSGESNFYGILQVDFKADYDTIRKQYRKLALVLHPDKNKAYGAEAAFKHISEAWSTLSDSNIKASYDKRWYEHVVTPTSRPSHGTFQNPNIVYASRVPVSKVNDSRASNMNWAQRSHGQAKPQIWPHHVHQQQGHTSAPAFQERGHAQQGHTSAPAFQQRGHAQGYGQGRGHAHVPSRFGQQQLHGQGPASHQQGQERTHGSQDQRHVELRVPPHHGQGQGQGLGHVKHVPPKHSSDQPSSPEQHGLSHVHVHQQDQVHIQVKKQGQAHGHEQGVVNAQQQQGQVNAQQQKGQDPAHGHQQQGKGAMQVQGQACYVGISQNNLEKKEQQVKDQVHTHPHQGQGLPQQRQGQEPTEARLEAHQTSASQNHHAEHAQAAQNHAEHKQTHVSKPSEPAFQNSNSTFWTACPSCRMQLEYERAHMDKNLCCPMCYKPFVSKEVTPVRGNVLWPPKGSSKTSGSTKNNLSDATIDMAMCTDTGSSLGIRTYKKENVGTEDNICRQNGQKTRESTVEVAQKSVKIQQQESRRRRTDELRKQAAVQAKEGLAKLIARSKGVIVRKLSEEKERKAAAEKVSAIEQKQEAEKHRSALAGGLSLQKKHVAAEEGYLCNLEENSADVCILRVETCKSTGPCKRARVSQKIGVSKVEALRRKRKAASLMDRSRDRRNAGVHTSVEKFEGCEGAEEGQVCNGSSLKVVGVAAKVAEECKMEVPDPDFHNFDGDRTEEHFATGQVWATYDDDDGMPRYYARVNSILSLHPFKLQMNWLEARNPSGETRAWLASGFQHSCGDFVLGNTYIADEVSTFSHLMSVDKALRGCFKIYPRKGDVWALYKDWECLKVKEDKRGYDMVEVVTAYDDENGLRVFPLIKVAGFKTIFERKVDEEGDVQRILPQEMRRLSHQVPVHRIAAGEILGVQGDCVELDPASTPMDLIYGKP